MIEDLYDAYGNLTCREYGYWSNGEVFDYDNLNRLVATPAGDISYDCMTLQVCYVILQADHMR